jgi:hypothetical protein
MAKNQRRGQKAAEATAQSTLAAGLVALSAVHPDLAVPAASIAAAAGTYLPHLVDRIWTFRIGRIGNAVAAGAQHVDVSVETLVIAAAQSPFRELLTADVFDAASRSAFDDKVTALGRAWAVGVLAEDDVTLAKEQLFVRTIDRIELPHVKALEVVARDPFADAAARGGPPLVDGWTPDAVARNLPEYGPLVQPLLATLTSEGLIVNNTIQNPMAVGTQFRITDTGIDVLRRLRDAAGNSATEPGTQP